MEFLLKNFRKKSDDLIMSFVGLELDLIMAKCAWCVCFVLLTFDSCESGTEKFYYGLGV